MHGRLNVLQKCMLQWNDLHPYNAVHVVRIPGALELERLRSTIATTLEGKGLTGLSLNRSAGTYEYHGGPAAVEVGIRTAVEATSASFVGEMEHQLNTPFSQNGRFCPFRFFVVPDLDSFSLGLVYFHPIADAESILILLMEMVDTYRGEGSPGLVNPVDRYPRRWDNLLRYHPVVLARTLFTVPSLISNMRCAHRPQYRDPSNLNNKFVFFSLGPQTLSGMAHAAKSLSVTLNDLFLALLMKAFAFLTPDRTRETRRRGLALGCIVNLRKDLGIKDRQAFGLFLGSFVIHHDVPRGMNLGDLARDIRRQTFAIKRRRLYLGSPIQWAFAWLVTPLFSAERRRELYRKHYPLWGGLTNMDLNHCWPQPPDARAVDYCRAVSTGPVTPLVLSITTIGPVANIGLTYRPTVFSALEIERIKDCFLDPMRLLTANL